MLEQFAAKVEEKSASKAKEFLDTLGAAIGNDWKVEHVDIYAFNRSYKGEAGTVWSHRTDAWLPAGGTWEFALGHRPLRHRWHLPVGGIKLPAGGLKLGSIDKPATPVMKVLTGARAAKILAAAVQKDRRGGGISPVLHGVVGPKREGGRIKPPVPR